MVAFDRCLDETQDDIDIALTKFSERQVPQGLALWQLLQLPPKGFFGVLYQLSQVVLNVLGRFRWLRKFLPRATQTYLSQTLLPFTEIVRRVSQITAAMIFIILRKTKIFNYLCDNRILFG